MANILSPLQSNKYTIKNSQEFAEVIKDYSVSADEILVSFDVVSLFTSIPTALALEVSKQRLEQDVNLKDRTNLSVTNIMKLLEFVLDNNYFVYQGTHYKQVFGCPMGSPVSAILANLVMEHIEEEALNTEPHPPRNGGSDTWMTAMFASNASSSTSSITI